MLRGGWRQWLGQQHRSRSPPPREAFRNSALWSEKAKLWLESYAWGAMSAANIMRNAQADVADGGSDPLLKRMAKVGHNLQNSERAIGQVLPESQTVATEQVADSNIEIISPPHKMMAWLWDTNPRAFKIHLGASEGGVQDWWQKLHNSAAGRELWALHPWLRGRSPEDLRWHLPLVLHDDAGHVSHSNSAYVRSWHSIMGKGREFESRFLIASGMKSASALEDFYLGPKP